MKVLTIMLFAVLMTGCKKLKEQVQEDIIIKAMTEGQWRMSSFTKGGTDMTASFSPYLFQFRANNTVEAMNNGAVEKTGSWSADPMARTISSQFANASNTLLLLNGVWKITNNSWTFVEATQTVNGEVLTLRLDK